MSDNVNVPLRGGMDARVDDFEAYAMVVKGEEEDLDTIVITIPCVKRADTIEYLKKITSNRMGGGDPDEAFIEERGLNGNV